MWTLEISGQRWCFDFEPRSEDLRDDCLDMRVALGDTGGDDDDDEEEERYIVVRCEGSKS